GDPQEDDRRSPRRTRHSRHEGSQEQRAVCGSRAGQGGEGKSQGSHGSQSSDRRGHQDSGQDRGEIPSGEGVQRRGGPSKKEIASSEVDFPRAGGNEARSSTATR